MVEGKLWNINTHSTRLLDKLEHKIEEISWNSHLAYVLSVQLLFGWMEERADSWQWHNDC